jgi:hypothetical protein
MAEARVAHGQRLALALEPSGDAKHQRSTRQAQSTTTASICAVMT